MKLYPKVLGQLALWRAADPSGPLACCFFQKRYIDDDDLIPLCNFND